MRFDADAIEHENIQAAKTFERIGRDGFQIGRVCKVIETIRHDRQLSVDDFERRNVYIADAKWRIMNDRVRYQLRQAAAGMRRLKNILKDPPHIRPAISLA